MMEERVVLCRVGLKSGQVWCEVELREVLGLGAALPVVAGGHGRRLSFAYAVPGPTTGYDPSQRVERDRTLVKRTRRRLMQLHRRRRHPASIPSRWPHPDRQQLCRGGPRMSKELDVAACHYRGFPATAVSTLTQNGPSNPHPYPVCISPAKAPSRERRM